MKPTLTNDERVTDTPKPTHLVVGFTGPAGAGKDTAGAILIKHHGFQRLSFAQPLKAMLAAMGLPEPLTQDEKEATIPWLGRSWRNLAQTLGTEWGRRQVHADLWMLLAQQRIEAEGGRWVITDVRFDNEADLVRRLGGTVCHIRGRAHAMSGTTKTHASEAGVTAAQGDYAVNNGWDQAWLRSEIDRMMRGIYSRRADTEVRL